MKQWILSLLAAVLLLQPTVALAGSPKEAQAYIDGISTDVLDILKTKETKASKQAKLETLFSTTVDIPYVAKYVLGRHWNGASADQQKAYVAAYEPFIVRNYAGKLTKYSGQSYKLKNARNMGDDQVVTMEIVDPGSPSVFVDYRLREVSGSYKVVDIAVEGVSLVATQRSEFNAIVNRNGIDGLIAALQKQAAKKAA